VRHFISGWRKSTIFLEGSQALSARPSDKCNTKIKTLRWQEVQRNLETKTTEFLFSGSRK
jgi:hypothetical protein